MLSLNRLEESKTHLLQALGIAREAGERSAEGIILGNLGEVLLRLHRLEEGKECLLRAIEICAIAIPSASGTFRGILALLYATEGSFEKSFEVLEVGEPLVAIYPLEHGKFLCTKAKVYHLAEQPKETEIALEHAKAIATELNATEDSELGKAIAETRLFLSEKPSYLKPSL